MTIEHSRSDIVALELSRWKSYVRTQQMGQLRYNTAYGTDVKHRRWDRHYTTADETVTLGQLHKNTTDETFVFEESR